MLWDTVRRTVPQLAAALGFLFGTVALFAVLLYEVEGAGGSRACFAGDAKCNLDGLPEAAWVRPGDRVVLDETGAVSKFGTVFSSAWFAFLTATLVGLGDASPVTFGGRVLTITLATASLCFYAFPLAVAASTFFHMHEKASSADYQQLLGEQSKRTRQRVEAARAARNLRSALVRLQMLHSQLVALQSSLRRPPVNRQHALRVIELPLAASRSWLLSQVVEMAAELDVVLLGCRRDVYTVCFRAEKKRLEVRSLLKSDLSSAPRSL